LMARRQQKSAYAVFLLNKVGLLAISEFIAK
jgi:hypothetical protein